MTNDELRALVVAHFDGDDDRFRGLVLAMAANAEAKSPQFAKRLRDIANRPPRHGQAMTALPMDMRSMLAESRATASLDDMALESATRDRVDRVLLEQTHRDKLLEHGLRPMRKLLFVGPPGVGKTMMATALAARLQISMLRVQLHAVIASHLGETAGHLGKVFETIRSVRAVYLFDEFDAIAPDRGGGKDDVGEMRRVVNSLLQMIEDDDSDSIIIAATNHAGLLDRAIFRRFDDVIDFPLPTADVAQKLVESRLLWTIDIDWNEVRRVATGIGHADLSSACDRVNKDAILNDHDRVHTADLVAAIEARRPREEAS